MATRKSTARGRTAPRKTIGIEWVGGIVAIPAFVTGDDVPYRPEALIWMGADGAILGSTMGKPGQILPRASESLQTAIEQPMSGRSHSPTRVRVASTELAAALRARHPGLEVICAPTPELDEMLALMRETLAEHAPPALSWLSGGIAPKAIAAFFKSAAALFRAKPWNLVPDDQSIFSVTIEQLGVRDAAMSVIGQMGQSFGLILFSSLDAFEAYLGAADVIARGRQPEMPPHFALSFEHAAELEPELRKEVYAHRWEVAGANAYPSLLAIDEGMVARMPTGKEVTVAEAIALALTRVMVDEKELRNAWAGGAPVTRTLLVATHAGDIEVTLVAPYPRTPSQLDPARDVLADLAELSLDQDDHHRVRAALEDALIRRFTASAEARDFDEIHACRFVMDLGAHDLGHTIATLRAPDLRAVLFELLPRKAFIAAADARAVVEEMRAFYRFLKREFGLAQADACLRVLGSSAVKKLEAALSDSSKFGVAKSLFMAGVDAGFDMASRDGIEAWMQSIQDKPLPPEIRLPGDRPPASTKAAEASTGRRTAAPKRRRKNG